MRPEKRRKEGAAGLEEDPETGGGRETPDHLALRHPVFLSSCPLRGSSSGASSPYWLLMLAAFYLAALFTHLARLPP